MIAEIYPGLWIGDQVTCVGATPELGVVHACKDPCHRQAVGYHGQRALPPDHPHYLVLGTAYGLYLNLIDPPTPLFQVESFTHFLGFMDAYRVLAERPTLIHCNQASTRHCQLN
jgi:hypothetical protein